MSDLLTQRLAKGGGRARVRLSATERESVESTRKASRAAMAGFIESRNVAHYERTVARMQSLLTERTYALEDLARERAKGDSWIIPGTPIGDRLARIDGELAVVYGTPIRQSDIAPGGRYERFIAFHMRRIASRHTIGSMLITGDDARDILSLALVRAYAESALVEDERGQLVPTIGTLYRFGRAELMRTVSRARREVQTVSRDAEWYSEREEIPRNGAASLFGIDPARIDWNDRAAVKSILTPAPRWNVTPAPEDAALADRINARRARIAREDAARVTAERAIDRAETAEVAAYGEDDTLGIDAACVALVASGDATLDALAERLSIKRETVVRRLQSVRFRRVGEAIKVVRHGSDGRARAAVKAKAQADGNTLSRTVTRDKRTPEERAAILTRRRAMRAARVTLMSSLPTGWLTAEPAAHVVHYSQEAISEVREWTCPDCHRSNASSAHATLVHHRLDNCERDTAPVILVTLEDDAVPTLTRDSMHEAAHKLSRCNCGAMG